MLTKGSYMQKLHEGYNSKDYLSIMVGKEIARFRKEARLSGEQLANMVGISQQQVSRYERGACQITISILCIVLQKLNIPLNDFFEKIAERIGRDQPMIYHKFETVFSPINTMNSNILNEAMYSNLDISMLRK